jgi:hypothetical protein
VTNVGERAIEFPIAAWSAWAPGLESHAAWSAWAAGETSTDRDGTPDLPFVPAMLRRRLSRGARMMLWVTRQCLTDLASLRIVFASRHGELNRTVPMLQALAHEGELSPTDFSLSVHNAAAGVCSIVRQDRAPSISIAAGEESFGYGLIEAVTQWKVNPEQPVLMVYADEPVPEQYRRFVDSDAGPHAVAILLSGAATSRMRLHRDVTRTSESKEPQSLTFLRTWLRGQTTIPWHGKRDSWVWEALPHGS